MILRTAKIGVGPDSTDIGFFLAGLVGDLLAPLNRKACRRLRQKILSKFRFPETLMSSQCLFILGVSFLTPSEPSFLELSGCLGHRQIPEPFERTRVVATVDFSVTAVARFYPDESKLFEPSKPTLYRAAADSEFLL